MLFNQAFCYGEILDADNQNLIGKDLTVRVTITDIIDDGVVNYIASSPPDYHYSFTGSALPFPNPKQAFENTPNKGTIQTNDGSFTLDLLYPNSYYIGLGSVIVPPSLSLFYKNGGEEKLIVVKIANEVPFRLLTTQRGDTYLHDSCMFFKGNETLPIRTQEQILRGAGYPCKNKTPVDFWGLRPRW
jgi:hypothetical protein